MINLAQKFSSEVDEKFRLGSLTQAAVNENFDWTGAHSIAVYSVDTVPMIDYRWSSSGQLHWMAGRYGDPGELENSRQWFDITKDRSFTFTIDKGNDLETKGVMKARKALLRQVEEVVIPEVDVYRLSVMSASAIGNGQLTTAAITEDNAYSSILKAGAFLTENKVPVMGRIAFVAPSFYTFLKLDSQFITASDLGQRMLIRGQVGVADGVKIIMVPTSYLPANHAFMLCHPDTTTAAQKLEEYKIHNSPSGLSGKMVEGRIMYDCFVSENKKQGLYVHKIS